MKKTEALIFKQWDSEGKIQQHVAKAVLNKLQENTDTSEEHKHKMISVVEKTSTVNDAKDVVHYKSDFCIHSAFEDPGTDTSADAKVPARESIEVRCFALFE